MKCIKEDMPMYAIEDFLCRIKPYDGYNKFGEFMSELEKVPHYKEEFARLIQEDPEWLELALAPREDGCVYVYYLLDNVSLPFDEVKPNKLSLMRFSMNSQPVIKVTSYKKKTKQHKIRKF
jgi:hypothetical protein